ncbi:hypothetical protein G6F57_014054 [Rhizopus arrhizus]|nr:hypothetical protein G6F57_014054 [Rhizopus arrhizus]
MQNLAQLENARRDLQRYQALFKQDSIAKQQVDTQAALVRQYEGTVKSDQANVDNAKLQLDYARITAPISGRLGLRQVDRGTLVDEEWLLTLERKHFVELAQQEKTQARIAHMLKTGKPLRN